jgi:hypothetical protein
LLFLHRSPRPTEFDGCAHGPLRKKRSDAEGYAYIMALFLVLTVIVGSQVVLRNMAVVSRSQREAEAIWRGNQYARAIKMYYHKTGHFPASQDDLVTGVPGVHFLRAEAMKDPVNTQDGAWRFIYMNASGVIIGSVKYGSLLQMAMMDMNGGKMPGTQQTTNGTDSNSQSGNQTAAQGAITSPGSSSTSTSSSGPGSGFSLNATGPSSGNGAGSLLNSGNFTNMPMGPQPTGPVTGTVFGGLLIGVGSTVDQTSVRVYKGGTKYNQWEFIWNPLEEQAQAIQQGIGATGAPTGIPGLGLPIANPNGIAPTNGVGTDANSPTGGATTNPTTNNGDNGSSNPTGGANTSGSSNSSDGTNPSTPNTAPTQ